MIRRKCPFTLVSTHLVWREHKFFVRTTTLLTLVSVSLQDKVLNSKNFPLKCFSMNLLVSIGAQIYPFFALVNSPSDGTASFCEENSNTGQCTSVCVKAEKYQQRKCVREISCLWIFSFTTFSKLSVNFFCKRQLTKMNLCHFEKDLFSNTKTFQQMISHVWYLLHALTFPLCLTSVSLSVASSSRASAFW